MPVGHVVLSRFLNVAHLDEWKENGYVMQFFHMVFLAEIGKMVKVKT